MAVASTAAVASISHRCRIPCSSSSHPFALRISAVFPFLNKFTSLSTRSPLPVALCSPSDVQREIPTVTRDFAVLLEVEGILADVYRVASRQAFNKAFRNLGLDCAYWTEPIYADLLRKSAGDDERMVFSFFNKVGWPSSLPTNEKDSFVKNVIKEKKIALEEIAASDSLTLRPGVEDFIKAALDEGAPVVMLTAYSKSGEKTSRTIIEKLSEELRSQIKVIHKEEVERSFYGQLVLGKGASSSFDDQLTKELRKAASMEKQRVAEEVASVLKLKVDLDFSSSESFENVIAALRAAAEYAGFPVENCVLLAASQTGLQGAVRVGMPCIIVRNSVTARAEFHSAKLVTDGFGGADLTLPKLRNVSSS